MAARRRVPTQLTFEERRRFTRAGKPKRRPGPKPSARPNVRHRARGVHKHWNPMHVTLRAAGGLASFRAERLFHAFERAIRTTRRDDFRIVEFSVQDDHVHLIVEADDNDALARGMVSFSVRANRLIRTADDGPRPTEPPRTVLLDRAWHQKHGFIHPGERPVTAR